MGEIPQSILRHSNKAMVVLGIGVLLLTNGCSSVTPKLSANTANLLKRIPYKTEDKYRIINIFYATSRKTHEPINSPSSFKSHIAEQTSYGSADIKIDPTLTIATMLPKWYKRNEIIGIKNIHPLNVDEFMKELAIAVENSPHKSILVQVSGYQDNFEYTAIKTAYFSYLLDVNTPTLLFDWPGDQPTRIRGYLRAESLATKSGQYLANVLIKIIREIKPAKLWISASSLGCQVVCSAFAEMYKQTGAIEEDAKIDEVILAAPDVRKGEFDEKFKDQINAFSKSLTVYLSSNDRALLLSSIIDIHRKLGRQHIQTLQTHDQYEEAKELLYLKSLEPKRINLVDVTPINTATYRHGYYLEAPEFFDDFYLRIFERPPHVNRNLYLFTSEDGLDYWILRSNK